MNPDNSTEQQGNPWLQAVAMTPRRQAGRGKLKLDQALPSVRGEQAPHCSFHHCYPAVPRADIINQT